MVVAFLTYSTRKLLKQVEELLDRCVGGLHTFLGCKPCGGDSFSQKQPVSYVVPMGLCIFLMVFTIDFQADALAFIEPIWYLRIQLIVVVEVEENRDEFW